MQEGGSSGVASVPRHYLAVQHGVSQILAEAPTLPDASVKLLQTICQSLDWEVGAVWERDRAAGVVRCVAVWCPPQMSSSEFIAATRQRTFAPGEGVPGRIWSSGLPAWVPDVTWDENFPRAPYAARAGLHAAFGFPITRAGDFLGALEFFSREIRQPDEELLQLMASIGNQIGMFIDRQLAQDAIRESEARKAAILESAVDAIITMDHRGNIIEFNPAAERIFRYTVTAVIGRPLADLIAAESLPEPQRQELARCLETGSGSVLGKRLELQALRADGTEFPAELSVIRIASTDPPIFTGYLRDVTNRKQREREREDLLAREKEARREAEQANRLKDEFLATLSHELRTPLTSILGWARLLRSGRMDPQATARALESIERNASLQTRLVADLLDLSHILSGKFRLDMRPTDPGDAIAAALESVRPSADAKGIQLAAVIEPSLGPIVGDPDRLQQVVWNLLSNAIKFTGSGGHVTLRASAGQNHVEIVVEDTGQGIDRRFLPFVFDRFRQADGSTTRGHQGLGLGLAIVRHLVEMHGGTVSAASDGAGRGSVFTVRIPCAYGGDARPRGTTDAFWTTAPRLENVRVLLVEDDEDARDVVAEVLTRAGAKVTAVETVERALATLGDAQLDLLLSDIEMPQEDGYALIRAVRERERLNVGGGRLPAAALTGHARPADRERVLAAGYDCHLAKPFEPAGLIAAIAALTGRP